jgi:hypothetical protein
MSDPSELVASFIAFTGADEQAAQQMLEATGFDLEQAVSLYYAAGPSGAGGAPEAALPPMEDDEALARRLHECV